LTAVAGFATARVTRSIFIYWKTSRELAPAAVAGMANFQHGLRARQPGLVARLYRRDDDADAAVTLMETYARAGGIDATLQQELVTTGMRAAAGWCRGERHVEVFDELPAEVAAPGGEGSL
jgi:Domain of unknown function (DUF4936)